MSAVYQSIKVVARYGNVPPRVFDIRHTGSVPDEIVKKLLGQPEHIVVNELNKYGWRIVGSSNGGGGPVVWMERLSEKGSIHEE